MSEDGGKKVLMTKIVIGVLAAGLFLLWLANLKNVWRLNSATATNPDTASAWAIIQNDMNRTMAMARGQLKQTAEETGLASSTRQDFLLNLLALAQKQATTTPVASSTPAAATSSPLVPAAATTTRSLTPDNNNKNCPQYINCMPGPQRRGPCQVPAGCEGVTQVAY